MLAPPWRIETNLSIPELSVAFVPPYNPFGSDAGIPSICTDSASAEIGAFPKTNKPPHKPFKVGSRFGLWICPGWISSAIEVKIIGEEAVPTALILAPLAITNAVAFAPVPAWPLMIVPASMVKVAPLVTAIREPRIQILSFVHVVLLVMLEVTITSFSTGA